MIRIILKFLFAFGIVFFLIKNGRLDFSLIVKSWQLGHTWIVCAILITIQDMIACLRWKILLEIQIKKKIPFIRYVSVSWIGLFFNTILPGAVTGDLIKMAWVDKLDRKLSRSFLFSSILLDRIIGLCGLIVLLGGFSLFAYDDISTNMKKMIPFLQFNFLLFVCVILCGLFVLFSRHIKKLFFKRTLIAENRMGIFFNQIQLIISHRRRILVAFLISVIAQTINVIAFWVIASPFITTEVPFTHLFTLLPLGFIVMAIPLSPAGLGTGHAAFDVLLSYLSVENGASLFNLYFIILVSLHLLGIFPYVFSRKESVVDKDVNASSKEVI